MTPYITDGEIVSKFEVAVINAADQRIAPKLLLFGYHEEARQADLTLLGQVRVARDEQQVEYIESRAATAHKQAAKDLARSAFLQLHQVIRLADRNSPDVDLRHLLQTGELPTAETLFLDYASGLLAQIEHYPEVLEFLSRFGVNIERINELRVLLQAVRDAGTVQQKERGEAEQATVIYRELIKQLRLAYSTLRGIAKLALSDDPQLLELMGLGKM